VKSILIVEDEAPIRDMIQFILMPTGFSIWQASDTLEAEKKIAEQLPDLILLDWMLPDKSGIAFAKQLKSDAKSQNIPIIMLTAKAEEENKIKGLEIGADDYITKPFSPKELIARIKTVLRRGPLVAPDDILRIDEFCMYIHKHLVTFKNEVVELSPIEYKLLHFFFTHQERTYTREQLLDHVWGQHTYVDERTVDVHIRRLRLRLQQFTDIHYIKTIRGTGYQFSRK
jgi:two-component system, OmpR family, phosphate regulon response regulator PhoB